jgi:hypothetical protein
MDSRQVGTGTTPIPEGSRGNAGNFGSATGPTKREIHEDKVAFSRHMSGEILGMHDQLKTGGPVWFDSDITRGHFVQLLLVLIEREHSGHGSWSARPSTVG